MQKFKVMVPRRGGPATYLRLGAIIAVLALLFPSLAAASREEAARLAKTGLAKQHLGNVQAALTDYTRAIAADPKYAYPYNLRGILRAQQLHDTAGALADFNRAIALDPKYGSPYSNRGLIALEQGNSEAALADFNLALKLNSLLHHAYYGRGVLKARKHDFRDALIDFNGALAIKPDDPDAYATRGEIKMELGDMAGAVADEDRALSLAPKSALYYATRSSVKGHAGDAAGALEDGDRAVALDRNHSTPFYCRGLARYQTRRWAEAVPDYRRSLELPGANKDYAHFHLWLARARLGQTADADKELSAYLANRRAGKPGDWAGQVGKFLLNGTPREAFLVAANTAPDSWTQHGQQCEAAFYAGMKKLLAGDRSAADDLRRCVGTKMYGFVEYRLAAAELKTPAP